MALHCARQGLCPRVECSCTQLHPFLSYTFVVARSIRWICTCEGHDVVYIILQEPRTSVFRCAISNESTDRREGSHPLKPPHSPFHESFSSVSVAKRICAPEVCNIISLNEAHITHIGYSGTPTRPAVMHQCSSNAVLFYSFNHLCDSCL